MRSRAPRPNPRLTVLLIVCALLVGSCSTNDNLLERGDFEPQSTLQKSPAGWFATEPPATKEFVDFTWDDQIVHGGQRSVSIAVHSEHPEDTIHYNWTTAVPACAEGMSYELSGWVKTRDLGATAWIVAQCWDEALSKMLAFATTQQDYPLAGTNDWTQVGTVFTVPPGTREVRIRAGISAPESRGGQAWFDDLRVLHVP